MVAGVKHLMVCMNDTGTKRSETLPRTMFRQVRAATGMIRTILSRVDWTTISGFKRNTCEGKEFVALSKPIIKVIKMSLITSIVRL